MSDQSMRDMADMIRKGAKMLSISCPDCGSPLFQMKNGEVICPREKREVRILKEGEDETQAGILVGLEKTLTGKLDDMQRQLETEKDPDRIKALTETIIVILEALKRVNAKKS